MRFFYSIVRKLTKFGNYLLTKRSRLLADREIASAESYKVIESSQCSCPIYEIKPSTVEKIEKIPIYEVMDKGHIEVFSPAIICREYENATITDSADYILLNNHCCVWSKSNSPIFTKNVPMDYGLLKYSSRDIVIRNKVQSPVLVKKAFSLCGVYADVWSHFMIQRSTLLASLPLFPSNILEDLTIIVPDYADLQLKQIVYDFLAQELPNVHILSANKGQQFNCELLYSVESATAMIDNESYVSDIDMVIPKCVAETVKTLYPFHVSKRLPWRKIFIRRRGAYRNLINNEEVEQLFEAMGFQIIEPHLLSYLEKTQLFSEAMIIAGPYSSGFSNLIYCKPGTRVLILTNLQRAFEPFLTFYVQHWKLNAIFLTGDDIEPTNSHSDYFISLDRVKQSYNFLINKSK